LVNEKRLIYSIIREIQNGHKIFPDEQSDNNTVLDSSMFVDNKFIWNITINKMENVYIYKKYIGNKQIRIPYRDVKPKALEFIRNHSELNETYPGLNDKLKEWINEPE